MRTAPAIDDEPAPIEAAEREPHPLLLLAFFAALTLLLAFRDLGQLTRSIPGDSGDSILNLWIMRTVQHGVLHGWGALWNAPNFHPASTTLAYSDTLFPVALVHWPLRLVLGDTLAFNVIYLGSWVLSAWSTYRVAARFVRDWRAAAVGALTYTFSTITLTHHSHFQLVVGSALVPTALLLLIRTIEAPSLRRGLLFGATFAAVALSASYYGAMMVVFCVPVIVGALWPRPSGWPRPLFRGLIAGGVIAVAIAGPFAYEYVQLQRHPEFRRGFEQAEAAHPGDFASTGFDNYYLRKLPVISSHSRAPSRTIENRLFPGVVAITFGIAGIVIVARRRRDRLLLLLALGGLLCFACSFGDWFRFAGHRIPLPFSLLRHFVPGFAGMRATARLWLGGQLALAMFAAIGVEAALARLKDWLRLVASIALVAIVAAETATSLLLAPVPTTADDGGISTALRARPAGVVAELPLKSASSGVAWPYVEAPRQYAALRSRDEFVNGYSGFQPKNFDQVNATLARFPAPEAVAEARRLGVRYIVLRTALVGKLSPSGLTKSLSKDGVGRYSDASAASIVAAMPSSIVARVDHLAGGYLVELKP